MKNSSNFATVHKVYDSIEAELIRGYLESEGAECGFTNLCCKINSQ